jgi:hypothetical protein
VSSIGIVEVDMEKMSVEEALEVWYKYKNYSKDYLILNQRLGGMTSVCELLTALETFYQEILKNQSTTQEYKYLHPQIK